MIKKLLQWLIPPPAWQRPVIIAGGIFTGLAVFVFYVSNAASYLSEDPKTCINCHVMNPQFATWFHSSHREVASCTDCHVPHDNVFRKYYFKAQDGMRHATIFTMRTEPQVIQIKEAGQRVVKENCIRCHTPLLENAAMNSWNPHFTQDRTERSCWECHREIPHGRVKSLSATPNAMVPDMGSPVPDWLKKLMNP
ncbi:MAG: cytochrome c nitrite reductase small subunit [Bacteroidales bacterium]|jgi:cytochrome c nitrite reductase small subunit|nr:cytochrome c nitrite reductase small subunit [Bacteroidales bacterium]